MKYSIVIPCYKSSHTIAEVVKETAAELERLEFTPYEFVLVDDFSPDGGATVRELVTEGEHTIDVKPAGAESFEMKIKIVGVAGNSDINEWINL